MNCPVCGDALREIEKYQVRIDICPGCKGVWLDRGELEKVVAMAAGGPEGVPLNPERRNGHEEYMPAPPAREPQYRPEQHYPPQHRKQKKGHWLGELFEVFD